MNPMMFMLAGKAIFTVLNESTGNRMTFKVVKKEGRDGKPVHFVSAMNGPSNIKYAYLGTIFEGTKFVRTAKSHFNPESIVNRGFKWVFETLTSGKSLPENIKFFHEGRCGKCGKRLTVPESIETGFGPECCKMMGI